MKVNRGIPAALSAVVSAFTATLFMGLLFSSTEQTRAAPDTAISAAPAFVSSGTCAECHAETYNAWQESHHSWALRQPHAENVLGDFDNAVFEHRNVRSRFFRRDGTYFVETDGPDGRPAEFEVKYTVGFSPLQQYLVELERGRLQVLDIAWDTQRKKWFHLYPDENLEAGDGLHWSGPYKNWQARCAECHQTDFTKGYLPEERTYQSQWSELTVGCEACHGPGAAHVAWARNPASFTSERPQGLDKMGLTVAFVPGTAEKEVQICAPCHSRRSPVGANSPLPGSKFGDNYRLTLLEEGLYHADGQINGEVYVYGSFLQSKMYARGVRCSNCHEPHSGALRTEENAVCTQCHSPAGNADFPTLTKSAYDNPAHHHHEIGSEGSKCVNCHMPAKTYMQIDPRRDHSFRVPRPDLTQKIGTPNACTGCHDDKSTSWAIAALEAWFPNGRMGTPHYGESLHAGRAGSLPEAIEKLIALALDDTQSAIVRATALDLLRSTVSPEILESVSPLLKEKNSVLRSAVLPFFQAASPQLRAATALSMIDDPVRTVRIEAAKLLLGMPPGVLSDMERNRAQRAIAEYQSSLFANADYPETQMQIAGLAMTRRKFDAAEAAFRDALSMDPQLVRAWITLARIQWARQHPDQAIETLESAARKIPDSRDVLLQLGSLHLQQRHYANAVTAFEKSLKLGAPPPELLDMLAVSHLGAGDIERSRQYADQLVRKFPAHRPSPVVRRILAMPR